MSEVIDLLKSLVAIDSVNPSLVDGGAGETETADFLQSYLQDKGFTVSRIENTVGRPSLVAIAKGKGGGRSLMFNGHLDTVSVEGYDGDPFDPLISDGWLYGRGSADMKAGVAAMITAARQAAQKDLSGDIIVTCVSDEEHASLGTQDILAAGVRADAAIVPEPVGLTRVTAHKGFIWFDLEFEGLAAHGSRPDKGVDAIVKAGKFLAELDKYASDLAQRAPHPMLGAPSVHASLIDGGVELSSYPSRCSLSIERRTVPGETLAGVQSEVEDILNALRATDPQFKATLSATLERQPYECDPSADIVVLSGEQLAEKTGASDAPSGMNGWTDCALLGAAGIPSILIGPKGRGGHSSCESVSVASVEDLTDVLTNIATAFCGGGADDE